jgi:dihydroxyacetone kinase-like predicted kinase
MKTIVLLLAGALIFAACSSPKYAYHFDHYDYNSGKKAATTVATTTEGHRSTSPLLLPSESAMASSSQLPVTQLQTVAPVIDKKLIAERITAMSKAERKQLKKDLKEEMKKYSQMKKSPENVEAVKAIKAWDHDLKMAAIFGAIGLVLSLFYGVSPVFWVLGVIAIVVALVFLIMWLSRQ